LRQAKFEGGELFIEFRHRNYSLWSAPRLPLNR
jgi:hypothetical protein